VTDPFAPIGNDPSKWTDNDIQAMIDKATNEANTQITDAILQSVDWGVVE
jgi:hypothetical protein